MKKSLLKHHCYCPMLLMRIAKIDFSHEFSLNKNDPYDHYAVCWFPLKVLIGHKHAHFWHQIKVLNITIDLESGLYIYDITHLAE